MPDLPGLGVVGRSVAEVKRLVREAIELHVLGLREDGLPVPRPLARSLKVAAPLARAKRTAGHRRARSDEETSRLSRRRTTSR